MLAVPAQADPGDRRQASTLEEILVTAQRREESIRDVPIAMQAFTGETLKRLGIVDTRDLANIIPGFSYAESGMNNPIFTLRGIGFDDSSRTANSAVGVYVDEVPIPYPYMTQGADVDIERIEVLKGPQGTLYGRNTTGGAINYIASKPTDSLELGFEAEYGRFESLSIDGYLSGPFTERLRGRIAFRHIESGEGWQKSLTRPRDRLGEKDKQAARATLEWDPVEVLRLSFTLDWWRDRSDPQAPQPIAIRPQNPNLTQDQMHPEVRDHPLAEGRNARLADWAHLPWRLDNEFLMPAVRAYWDATDRLSLALIAAYVDFETGQAFLPRSGLSVTSVETGQQTDANAHSLELRADGWLFDERLNWLLGFYTSKDSLEEVLVDIHETNSAPFNIVPGVYPIADRLRTIGEQDARSHAVFGNIDYALTDQFELSLGARYTDEKRKFAGCFTEDPEGQGIMGWTALLNGLSVAHGGSGGAEVGECLTLDAETRNPSLIRNKLDENNVGGKVALTWTPMDNHLFYLSYSRGFKSGSFPLMASSEGEQFDPVQQERVDAIELGGKTGWFNDALRFDFALFDYDYVDKQLLSYFNDPQFGPLPKLFNVPKSKVRGAELEVQASPLSGLFVSAAASFLDTEVSRFVGVTAEGEEDVDFSGNTLPYAPKRSFTLLASYSFPLPLLASLEGSVGFDYSYVSSATSEVEEDPTFNIPSYELVNARFGVGSIDGHWDVTAWVRNATNEFYQLNVPQVSADSVVRFTGMPRTYGVTFSYRYF